MPWKPSDAKTHLKDATPKQAVVWAKVANAALNKCETDGGKDCEAAAIKQANAAAGKIEESAHPVVFLGIDSLELSEADLSFGVTRQAIQSALQATTPNVPGFYTWIKDVWADRFVYESESPTGTELYQRTYTLNADSTATLGDPVKVVQQTDYVPVGQTSATVQTPQTPAQPAQEAANVELSGDVIPLWEAAAKSLASGTAKIKVAAPGWGSSAYYSAEVLERDGPKAFPAGTHMFLNHPTKQEASARPERNLLDIAAVTKTAATFEKNGPDGPGLYAEAAVVPVHKPLISALAPHIGTSMRISGQVTTGEKDGKKGYIAETLIPSQHNSIDFVTRAGAGGKVLEIIESARGGQFPPVQEDDMELTEALAALEAEKQKNVTLTEAHRKNDEELARYRVASLIQEAKNIATTKLAAVTLPDISRTRLAETLSQNPPTKDGALDKEAFDKAIDEAAKTEADYIAKLTGSGRIHGMGGGADISQTDTSEGTLAESFKALGLSEASSLVAAKGRG